MTRKKIPPGWTRARGPVLRQNLLMKDFMSAVRFIRAVAKLAEAANHHPDIHLTGYRRLRLELWTHSTGTLTEKDFLLAGKINRLPRELKK